MKAGGGWKMAGQTIGGVTGGGRQPKGTDRQMGHATKGPHARARRYRLKQATRKLASRAEWRRAGGRYARYATRQMGMGTGRDPATNEWQHGTAPAAGMRCGKSGGPHNSRRGVEKIG